MYVGQMCRSWAYAPPLPCEGPAKESNTAVRVETSVPRSILEEVKRERSIGLT